jgi:predicted nucleic acid-binding protein
MATLPDSTLPVFLDTAYVYALVNTRDQWHEEAVEWQRRLAIDRRSIITTELILVEIADGLAAIKFRAQAAQIITTLQSSQFVEVIPLSSQLLSDALNLYRSRQDKDWGLTDCASFVTMRERSLLDALTVDEHFLQAGFRALLREK